MINVGRTGEVTFDDLGADRAHLSGLPVARPDEASDVVAVLQEAVGDVGTHTSGDPRYQ